MTDKDRCDFLDIRAFLNSEDQERYDKWLKVGAQPSGTLAAVIRRTARAAAPSTPAGAARGGA